MEGGLIEGPAGGLEVGERGTGATLARVIRKIPPFEMNQQTTVQAIVAAAKDWLDHSQIS